MMISEKAGNNLPHAADLVTLPNSGQRGAQYPREKVDGKDDCWRRCCESKVGMESGWSCEVDRTKCLVPPVISDFAAPDRVSEWRCFL